MKARRIAVGEPYGTFAQLDGRHPWRDLVPEGMILYPVRRLSGGKVSYFNFALAKEMGLIPASHPERMNKNLNENILNTFCLRIINEFDQKKGTRFPAHTIKAHPYMATRYLQLQHADKSGRTSGDGRCIWNGVVKHQGAAWDVSSRGTGVTALAPGAVQAGVPLKSGNTKHGYGCGMAEIDELFGAAILAEIFHRNGIPTERVLAIIDLGKGVGIGVRAAPNLLRPAHLFSFVKQGRIEPLRRATDYFISRQCMNRAWNFKDGADGADRGDKQDKYGFMLSAVTRSFARFAARLDRDYIFAWLEWDGDNVLADAGVIDYGSVRQFGLRHDQYRYDDVERLSTNLNEQRIKAREIVQTYVQLVDFLRTGKKKPFRRFKSDPALKAFDEEFHGARLDHFLFQVGLAAHQRRLLLNNHRRDVEKLFSLHVELERVKTSRKLRKVADGVHRPAIFNMRIALSEMARHVQAADMRDVDQIKPTTFFTRILSTHASRKDRKLTSRWTRMITHWQSLYLTMLKKISTPETWKKTVNSLSARAERINHSGRITGNALIHVVDEILRYRRRGLSDAEIQDAIEGLIAAQTLNPDFNSDLNGRDARAESRPRSAFRGTKAKSSRSSQPILRSFLTVVDGFREDI